MDTDYLVIGAGAMGLAFADELFTRSDAHITIVDKRHAPGGHWNDAYSSAALIALLEATVESDDEKNQVASALPIPDTVEEYLRMLVGDMRGREACNRRPALREWTDRSRTDGFTRAMRSVKPTETDKLAILARLREASKRAAQNLPKLLATLG